MSDLVSVVIPCHDREATVAEAVRSVLDQDWPIHEVVAVDDRSTDGTLAVLRGIDDARLRIVHSPRGPGAGPTRNAGIAAVDPASGWIAFQDSDDIWLPGKLRAQMTRLLKGGFVASYCGMTVKPDAAPDTPALHRHPDPAILPLSGDILPSLVRGSYLSTQMLVIRRDALDRTGGFDEALPALEDWELMLRIAALGAVDFVDEDLVVQRMSANSVTRSDSRRIAAQEAILEKHRALLERDPAVLAHHHHRLAGAYRAAGDRAAAARHAAQALRAAPGMPKYLAHLIWLRARMLLP